MDRRLSEDKDCSVMLAAEEWQSGDILWIIDAVGHPDIVPAFLNGQQGVARTVFVGLDDLGQGVRS